MSCSGWYAMNVLDMRFNGISIGAPASQYNTGQGIVVDSGTTDSYFPSSIRSKFKEAFKAATGFEYNEGTCVYSRAEMQAFPDLEVIVEGTILSHCFEIILNIVFF